MQASSSSIDASRPTPFPMLEWAPFRLAAGATQDQLLAASRALHEGFLSKQPGFLGRVLLRGRDGRYADLVRWASRGHVERAIEAAAESPVCFVYFRLMAGDGEAGGDVRLFDCVVSRLPGGTPGEIVEWTPFQPGPGQAEADRFAREPPLGDRRSGFVGRELLRGDDGEWVELLHWAGPDGRIGAGTTEIFERVAAYV